MQPKKSAVSKKTSPETTHGPANVGDGSTSTQTRVGRPPTSPLDRKSQVRENVRAHRARLKASGMEKVETYLPKAWQRFLLGSGESIQRLGLEAFALLLEKRGAAGLVQAARPMIDTAEDVPA